MNAAVHEEIQEQEIEEDEEDKALLAIEQSVKDFHKYEESVQELDYEIDALTKKLAKEIEEESKQSD